MSPSTSVPPVAASADEHTRAVLDLMPVLAEVKTWVRHLTQAELADRAGASLSLLAFLDRCGTMRVSDLASVAQLDASVVSRQGKALESAGLVQRVTDPSDGRAHRLRLTEAGHVALAEGRSRVAESVTTRLAAWTPAELDELTRGIRRLLDDLNPSSLSNFQQQSRTDGAEKEDR